MEGGRRGAAAAAHAARRLAIGAIGCALALAPAGCGGDDPSAVGPGAVRTANPERTFAPLLEVAADEPWRPLAARWFVEHSLLGISGCENRPIATGRALPELRNEATDWIFVEGIGRDSRSYYRNVYVEDCQLGDGRLYADQLTRPYDPGSRLEGLSEDQGFYLDLADEARSGPPPAAVTAPVYVERVDEGDSRVRLTYWTLYGMHGTPGEPTAHEGDWERVDVLLRADGDRYEPEAVQVLREPSASGGAAQPVDTAWSSAGRVDRTHPVVRVAPATHTMVPVGRDEPCADCVPWRTWDTLDDARDQLWYGFGGAWGEVGGSSATTGPLGPHGYWPTPADKERDLLEG